MNKIVFRHLILPLGAVGAENKLLHTAKHRVYKRTEYATGAVRPLQMKILIHRAKRKAKRVNRED